MGQGIGYYQGYYGSTFGVWSQWYDLGNSDGGGAFVPWGQVIANEQFKAMCAQTFFCWGNFWDF